MFHLITSVLMLFCTLYLSLRCVRPLLLPLWLKGLLYGIIFVCAYKLQLFRLIFPGAIVPEIPRAALILSGWFFAATILLVLLSLGWDVCLLLRRCLLRPANPPRHERRVAVLVLCALLLSTWSVWQAVRIPDVHTVEVTVPHLPPALDGLRIVQLSDLHISPLFRKDWTRAVVEKVNALQPDMVVFTGDMIDGDTVSRAEDVAPLADVRARYGVFGCVGNHEYYSGLSPWLQRFAQLGIHMLVNSHVLVPVYGKGAHAGSTATLVLGGVADASGAARVDAPMPDVSAAFAGSPAPDAMVWRVLLAHQPRGAENSARHGVGLQMSGHTHGGQLFPVSHVVGRFNAGYLAGLYAMEDMQMFVSRGAGLWGGFPVRLGAPAEITEIILRYPRAAGAGSTD